MDSFVPVGEKPMMPAPPKVWPVRPVVVVVPEFPLAPVPLAPARGELPDPPDGSVGLEGVGADGDEPIPELLEPKGELVPKEDPDPPIVELPVIPLPPVGPVPAIVEAEPARGWPKNPMAVGVLFWP